MTIGYYTFLFLHPNHSPPPPSPSPPCFSFSFPPTLFPTIPCCREEPKTPRAQEARPS